MVLSFTIDDFFYCNYCRRNFKHRSNIFHRELLYSFSLRCWSQKTFNNYTEVIIVIYISEHLSNLTDLLKMATYWVREQRISKMNRDHSNQDQKWSRLKNHADFNGEILIFISFGRRAWRKTDLLKLSGQRILADINWRPSNRWICRVRGKANRLIPS
jgi:hypothetical protein